jgi:6,7-dimethyl-8-ribityllumazine synthase
MPTNIDGHYTAGEHRFAIASTRFNSAIVELLVDGAIDALARHGVADASITVVRCPGSWELPLVCDKLAKSGSYAAIVACGCVIRGETPHFDHVAAECSKGISHVSLATGVPILNAVLTTDTVDQAQNRAGIKSGNKGFDCALAALEMADLLDRL